MRSLRSTEGYVSIDHRDSPGVPGWMEAKVGLKPGSTRGFFETAVASCSHCQKQVMLRPDRSRDRGYCRKCDKYLCDTCSTIMARTFECVPFTARLDALREKAFLEEQRAKMGEGFGVIDSSAVSGETPTARSIIIPA